MMALAAIAFDLDGTLVDSAPDIAHALNTALHAHGLQSFAAPRIRAWIGDGPDALIWRALEAQVPGIAAEPTRLQKLRAAFDAVTLAAPLRHGRVFDGIPAVLEQLGARLPLVVVTNKPTALAHAVLEAAGLRHRFAQVHGADAPELRKPAPRLLWQACAALNVAPSQMLMVGDSGLDVRAAHHAGCSAALALWGYGDDVPADDSRVWRVATPHHLIEGVALASVA